MGNIFPNNRTQEDEPLSNKLQQLEKENENLTNELNEWKKRKRESSDMEDKASDQGYVAKRFKHDSRSDSKFVITFSGFKSHAEYYTKSMKKEICALVKELALDRVSILFVSKFLITLIYIPISLYPLWMIIQKTERHYHPE
jgi:regulator of replication initiation timing